MSERLTIGKVASITGASTRSIRHYDKLGLLPCKEKSESGYRLFDEGDIERLKQILLFKSLSFSLNEIQEIMSSDENVEVSKIFERRLNELNDEMNKLNRSREMLQVTTQIYKSKGLSYVNNYHLIKEMIAMNTKFIRVFNRLDVKLQIVILKELFETGTLKPSTIRAIGEENGHLFLEELHMVLVKQLLNGIDFETEKNIMETLKEDDPKFAHIAMKSMFTFDDLGRLPDETLEKWLKKCSDRDLAVALFDCNSYLTDKLLRNVSEERKGKIQQQINAQEMVSLDEGFQVMEGLIETLRSMEHAGEIIIGRFEY